MSDGQAKKPAPRRGAFVLDKQLARAAMDRRKVTFMVNLGSNYEVPGYIVGMDDYIVMVCVPSYDRYTGDGIGTTVTFVHKGSAAVTKISPDQTLDDESELVRTRVTAIGSKFWAELAAPRISSGQETSG